MKEQKFIITKDESDIQEWLDRGWEVISVTAQYVSVGGAGNIHAERGKFAVVLQKQKENSQNLNS
jgi:hypothetical protein